MVKNLDKNTSFSQKRVFDFNGKRMDFRMPRVMGIMNVTPDSFYDGKAGSKAGGQVVKDFVMKAEGMVRDGAYIIDIGAVSTRPGAGEVSAEEEKKRLIPVLGAIREKFPDLIISIDTYRAEIARMAAGEGADMINDISGGTFDPEMIPAILSLQIPYIIMHIRGTPATMQKDPVYDNVADEVKRFLLRQAAYLESRGHHKIVIDPGFGFGKTIEHNLSLLALLDKFTGTDYPVLAGLSRKSMINRVLGTTPAEALNGTTVLNTIALLKGAAILRVHDVKEAVEAVKLVGAVI